MRLALARACERLAMFFDWLMPADLSWRAEFCCEIVQRLFATARKLRKAGQ